MYQGTAEEQPSVLSGEINMSKSQFYKQLITQPIAKVLFLNVAIV